MPRRRMIGPDFWTDRKIGYLTREERGFTIGCIVQADDDGRLQADPAFLKAEIYKYDEDLASPAVKNIRDSCLEKMEKWPTNHPYRMAIYANSGEEYIFFPNWTDIEKPSHPTKSKLPAPPPELLPIFSGASQEAVELPSRDTPSQSSLGQSSIGKDSIGKSSGVQEDFTKFLDNEKDLTDFLMTTLEKYMPAGGPRAMTTVKKLWRQARGDEMDSNTFQVIYDALHKYPLPVVAKSIVKAVKYSRGKRTPYRYIQTIFEEQLKEYDKEHPP